LPQGRSGTGFCPRFAVQGYKAITQLSRLQKP